MQQYPWLKYISKPASVALINQNQEIHQIPNSVESDMGKLIDTGALFPVLMIVLVLAGSVQESAGRTCGSTFFSSLIQMIPCRAAVAPFSPIQPSPACCAAIKALGQPCLCVLINGPQISGVDRNMALQLPDKCTANFEPCEILKK